MKKYENKNSVISNDQAFHIKESTTFQDILSAYDFVSVKPSLEFWNYCKENAVKSIILKDYTNIYSDFIVHQKGGNKYSIEINIYNPGNIQPHLYNITD